ncbi:MAG: 2-hydroxychromene-2-carboxylate isomerase [Pseudomonadota bacterium]
MSSKMPDIEYFYSTHSAYAYIGSALLMDIAKRNSCKIVHRPVDLNPVIAASSGQPFGYRSDAHRSYFFDREIERWAEYRDVSLINHRPTWHDEPLALPNGFVIAAIQLGHDVNPLAHEILKAHWLEDANHNDSETLSKIAASIGIDAAPVLELALTEEIQSLHAENTREAIERSVFGSPTYFVRGDMFYGQDHLELVEHALRSPFSGNWPK